MEDSRFRYRAWIYSTKSWMGDFRISDDGVYLYEVGGECYIIGDSVKLIQSIGLKDKNGKLIYEGYIMIDDDSKEKLMHIALFKGCSFGVCQKKFWFKQRDFSFWIPKQHQANHFRIIGSIYENPELLEQNAAK